MRAHADERAWYEVTKRELTQREWKDVNYHAEAKGPVIRQSWSAPAVTDPPGQGTRRPASS